MDLKIDLFSFRKSMVDAAWVKIILFYVKEIANSYLGHIKSQDGFEYEC